MLIAATKILPCAGSDSKLPGPHDSRLGAGDHGSRGHVALIGATEDKQARFSPGHARSAGRNEAIVDGVDGDTDDEQ